MLKILWIMGEIAPEEQFLPLSTIFYYLMLDFDVKTGILNSDVKTRFVSLTKRKENKEAKKGSGVRLILDNNEGFLNNRRRVITQAVNI